jgi:hypothetical protein
VSEGIGKMASEIVYLLQGGPYCKIGRTKNLVKRIKVIQTNHPYPLVIVHTWEVSNAAEVEGYLHRKFASVKMKGEWFQLPISDIEALIAVEEWHIEKPKKEPKLRPLGYESRSPASTGSLRALLETRCNIHSCGEFSKKLELSRQHASGLWNGRDPLGLRLMRRIKEEFGISLDELAEVEEAVPGKPRERHRQPPPEPEV